MPLKLKYRIIDSKTGRVEKEGTCHSWVLQFLKILEHMMLDTAFGITKNVTAVIDTGNSSRNLNQTVGIYYWSALAPVNTSTYGIVLGTGTNAESPNDYALQTQIAHGSGSGQLAYGATSYVTSVVVGSDIILVVSRTFTNSSGATITINEIGIYFTCQDSGGTQRYFCIARDKLDSGVTINNGESKTVQYTITTAN